MYWLTLLLLDVAKSRGNKCFTYFLKRSWVDSFLYKSAVFCLEFVDRSAVTDGINKIKLAGFLFIFWTGVFTVQMLIAGCISCPAVLGVCLEN